MAVRHCIFAMMYLTTQLSDHICTVVSVAANGSTWVCDPNLESYALEQPEMLRSPDHRNKCHAQF